MPEGGGRKRIVETARQRNRASIEDRRRVKIKLFGQLFQPRQVPFLPAPGD
jgi:hypothetical protein